jgi:hypothetical protein
MIESIFLRRDTDGIAMVETMQVQKGATAAGTLFYNDKFRFLAVTFLLMLPLACLMRKAMRWWHIKA